MDARCLRYYGANATIRELMGVAGIARVLRVLPHRGARHGTIQSGEVLEAGWPASHCTWKNHFAMRGTFVLALRWVGHWLEAHIGEEGRA